MKSICIKTNDTHLLNYLLNEFDYIEIDNVYISTNKFKNYKNIIIHYTGNDNYAFIHEISCILSCFVIDEIEESILKRLILKNYFYFETLEQKEILDICYDIFTDKFNEYFDEKYNCLINDFSCYLTEHKSVILSGFINFRIKDYIKILESIVDEAVNSYVIKKEYMEFVSLLRLYINSQESNCKIVHLIYSNETSILLDENKNVINPNRDFLKAKYLSDITFSSNDFALNTLLNLIPRKIYIHLLDNYVDEFVHTLGLIFDNKVEICTDCDICKLYKNKKLKLSNNIIKNK